MAWGVFSFSSDGRARLAGVLRGLLIGQLILSLVMVIFCYNVSLKVMMLLQNIHKVTVFLLYGLILAQAYAMKLHYTGGLRLIALMLKCPQWPRISLVSRNWMVIGGVLPLNALFVYAACRATLKELTKDLSYSLCYGISQYLMAPFWKRVLDTMQIELNCCGAEMPSDWHGIPWINLDYLNEESDIVLKHAGSDGKVTCPATPYSCCTPQVMVACYHDPLQQVEWTLLAAGGRALAPASLHARGCVEAMRAPLCRALLGLHCCALLSLVLEVVILVLFQLLRSSAHDAVLRGDPRGLGQGGLCMGRGHKGERGERNTEKVVNVLSKMDCVTAPRVYTTTSMMRKKRRRKLRKNYSYPFLS